MQLEGSYDKLTEAGLGVVAISYDTVEILRSFADRKGGFRYTMLADPQSEIIERFGLRNPNPAPGSRGDGMAFPGTYIVDADGIVREKFFEDNHALRTTDDTILLKTFGVGGGRRTEVELPQMKFAAYASQDSISPGNQIILVVDIELPARMHLYAPGSDYVAVDLKIVGDSPMVHQGALELPEAEILYLEPIDESVPVYFDNARIVRELTLSPEYGEAMLKVDAILAYQTCDDEFCYLPAEFPLTFEFEVIQNDRQRASEDIRH